MSEGDIGAFIDTLIFEGHIIKDPDILNVYEDVYVVAYPGIENDGYIATFTIDSDGNISNSIINSYEFETDICDFPKILHIYESVYAVSYRGPGQDGYIKTFSIANDGTITKSIIDTQVYYGAWMVKNDFIHVSGSVYAVVFEGGSGAPGIIITITIHGNGQIDAVIDTLTFSTGVGIDPVIVHLQGNFFAVAYMGTGNNGFLVTIEIAANGALPAARTDILEFDTDNGSQPSLIKISDTMVAVAYRGTSSYGTCKTIEISLLGAIAAAVEDTLIFYPTSCSDPIIVHVSGDVYACLFTGDGLDGFIYTFTIAASGAIGNTTIDTFTFGTDNLTLVDFLFAAGQIYVACGLNPSSHGIVKTVDIETIILGLPRHELLMGIG